MAEKTAVELAQEAAQKAEQARIAAENLRDAEEVKFLDSVTHVRQINEGRTQREATRLKTKYLSVLGYQRWSALLANSR